MHEALNQDYTIVTQPGPGVMRAAFAINRSGSFKPDRRCGDIHYSADQILDWP